MTTGLTRVSLKSSTLILIMGVPGAGKTTLAKALLDRLTAVYLDNNFLADAFFSETRTDDAYLKLRDGLYRALYRIAAENLKVGNTVILDVPHVTHMKDSAWHQWLRNFVTDNQADLRIVRCWVDEKTLRKRIESRNERRDDWKLQNWDQFMEKEPIRIPIPFQHIELNTSERNTAEHVESVLNYLFKTES